MRNVTPPDTVVLTERHAALEHLSLCFHPQLTEIIRRKLTLAAADGMNLIFKAVQSNLSENGGYGVIQLTHQHGEANVGLALLFHEMVKDQHFSERRCSF